MTNQLWFYLGWVLAAGLLGFAIAAIFSGWLRLSRRLFLVPYFAFVGVFLAAFFFWSQIDLIPWLVENWYWGLLAGTLIAIFLIRNVRSKPASARSTGAGLLFDVLWVGLGYGAMDALFLNAMPVVAVWTGFSEAVWTAAWPGKIALGVLALLASLFVTLLYHLGYHEFRNRKVIMVLIGNSLITLTYLVSTNPLGAMVSHVVMHVAAVFRGPETVLQLPPHYSAPPSEASGIVS
ncbi:MAG: hypothetical protein GWN58_06475 [Anaerolineae bacterium]|nr:hypothetical protein [Anaerolineae bacterium]